MADDRFKYHQPTEAAARLHNDYRLDVAGLCDWVEFNVPECRERSLAITKLEEAMFWGNAAIARKVSATKQADE